MKECEKEVVEMVSKQVQSAVAPLSTILHEMHNELRSHITQEFGRIETIDDRLDNHLQIYANNGKESKRVADNLDILISRLDSLEEKNDTVYNAYIGASWIVKAVPWLISLIAGVLAIIFFKK